MTFREYDRILTVEVKVFHRPAKFEISRRMDRSKILSWTKVNAHCHLQTCS